MNRHAIQERVYASPLLRRLFVWQSFVRGTRHINGGDLLRGLRGLLRAWKHAKPGEFSLKRETVVRGAITSACWRDGAQVTIEENPILRAWVDSNEAAAIRRQFAAYPHDDRVRARHARENSPAARMGDLTILKRANPTTGEKGVLLVTFNDGIKHTAAMYDLAALSRTYQFVLEPSTWGYMDEIFLYYLGSDADVVVQAQNKIDYAWIESLNSNLMPSRLGAGDWIWPDPFPTSFEKPHAWDICMVSAWDPLKRHELLFRAVKRVHASTGRALSMVLIGYPLSWDMNDVERVAKRVGVHDQCTFLNHVPADVVIDAYERSRVSVLLSKREGANRAIYESWFANCPTIVYRHHRGVNLDQVLASGGVLADDDELESALLNLIDQSPRPQPATWAHAHTGAYIATNVMNDQLAALARARGNPYTTPIVPHHPRGYVNDEDRLAMAPEYERITPFLLPP